MKRIKNKVMLMTLVGLINSSIMGCGTSDLLEINTLANTQIENNDELQNINFEMTPEEEIEVYDEVRDTVKTEAEETVEEEIIEEPLIKYYDAVKALVDVNIRDIEGNIIGVLPEGKTLSCIDSTLEKFEVSYYDNIGYISNEYAEIVYLPYINRDVKKIMYALDEIELVIPEELTESGIDEIVVIPELECFSIYEEYEDGYLVSTNDYIGYVKRENLQELSGTFVVVDISDQELRLYVDNEIVVSSPVVTGKPSTPSDIGLFAIYDISYTRDLVGPGYRSYVDIMMKYNRGEGLHDAEYHTCADGGNHGWRDISEFGGNTYLTDGSHGCVNMPRDEVMEVSEYVEVGTPVLVKK